MREAQWPPKWGPALGSTFCWCPFSPPIAISLVSIWQAWKHQDPKRQWIRPGQWPYVTHSKSLGPYKVLQALSPLSSFSSIPPWWLHSRHTGSFAAFQHVRGIWASTPAHWGSLRGLPGSVGLLPSSFAQTSSPVRPLLASSLSMTPYASLPHRRKHTRKLSCTTLPWTRSPNTF